ncbi:MAG: hypothetical protein GY760_15610 [Deltaproteobacteria bacterium]|nr:hypothetical protein [Deltaproteobacteria bacterium]
MKRILLILLIVAFCSSLCASELINSDYDRYYHYLELTGFVESPTLMYKSYSSNIWEAPEEEHPWFDRLKLDQVVYKNNWMDFKILDPEIFFSFNTALPSGLNDGAMWQGKGLNSRVRFGFSWNTKYFSVTYYPELWFAQNLDFDFLPPEGNQPNQNYGATQGNIDYPQRMGDQILFDYSWGQTDIRFNYGCFTAGISTENIWLGPADQNALILSNNADGFPHFDIGVRKVTTVIGDIEARLFWGLLQESDFFNDESSDDFRLMSGLVTVYSPFFVPGLSFGASWVVNSPGGDFKAAYFFPRILQIFGQSEYMGSDSLDQKISLFGEWKFPSAGFTTYFEWAREDFSPSLGYIALAPEHSSFYTLGLKKSLPISSVRGFMFKAELSELLQSRDYEIDLGSGGSYYTHGSVAQGYTNKGKILGAAVGPGSDTQYISLDYYDKWGRVGAYFRRISWDKMYLYKNPETVASGNQGSKRLNVEMDIGASCTVFLGNFELFSEAILAIIRNDQYIKGNDLINFYMNLGVSYRF